MNLSHPFEMNCCLVTNATWKDSQARLDAQEEAPAWWMD